MLKRIEIPVPIHIKKFIEGEYVQYLDNKGTVKVDKRSELGKLIHFVAKVDPFPKKYIVPQGVPTLKLSYYDESYSLYFPTDKIDDFVSILDEMFRRVLVSEVRAVHAKSNSLDYSDFVRDVLIRYKIEPDIDIEFETARKIYRDYQVRIHKKFHKNIS